MKKFLIEDSERERILGMHYNAMGKSLVSEQVPPTTPPTTPQRQPAQASGNIPVTFKNGDNIGRMAFAGPKGLQIILKPEGDKYSVQFSGGQFDPSIEDVYFWPNNLASSKSSISKFVRDNIDKFVSNGVMTQDPTTNKMIPISADITVANDMSKAIYDRILSSITKA